ncbi:MAG: hypothetical protein L3J04_09900 [Robiginitomaculum sp.]|nr:hypothetical protein [Robiginitomaculum sp.]
MAGDIMYLLQNGFVFDDPKESTRPEHFKYTMEGTTPNSDPRTLMAIVIPGKGSCLKIVSVMWKDEK